jgi:hypothetical protein
MTKSRNETVKMRKDLGYIVIQEINCDRRMCDYLVNV